MGRPAGVFKISDDNEKSKSFEDAYIKSSIHNVVPVLEYILLKSKMQKKRRQIQFHGSACILGIEAGIEAEIEAAIED